MNDAPPPFAEQQRGSGRPDSADDSGTVAGEGAGAGALAPSVGGILAAERERQGLSIGEVAARLRLHPRQVSAIESERFDELPEGTFLRGFIRNYAKELRIDPAPLLEELKRRLPSGSIEMPSVAGPAIPLRDAGRDRVSRILVIGGAVAALALFAIVGWVAKQRGAEQERPAAPITAPPAPPASENELQPPPASPAVDAAPKTNEESPGSTVGAAAPGQEGPVAAESSSTSAQGGSLVLRFVFGAQPSWIEVTQGDGSVVYSGLNEPGTERRVVGQPPLKLVVGNASTVTLEWRGEPVELAPHIRSNDLARLTVE